MSELWSAPVIIAVDFDGTIVEHEYPEIGATNPEAFRWLKEFQDAGAKLILWTMRSDRPSEGNATLSDAVGFCRLNGIEFFGVNGNPTQSNWTNSPKAYAQLYIDDAAFGCPLRPSCRAGGRPAVDWSIVGPAVMGMLKGEAEPAVSQV